MFSVASFYRAMQRRARLCGATLKTLYYLIFLETRIIDHILPLMVWVYFHSNFLVGFVKLFFHKSAFRPFKVIQGHSFWYESKAPICDFLLICHRSYLASFQRYCRFLCSWTHPYSTPILGVFPLHQIACDGVRPSTNLKLISREIIFEVFQPMWSR